MNKTGTYFTIRWLFIFILSGILQPHLFSQEIGSGVKKILFLGNSITHQGNYVNDVETYVLTRLPERKLEFMNLGLPSETVSGLSEPDHAGGSFPRPDLHERLQRVLQQTRPDLVIACYGMNDGIYLPFDNERFDRFIKGVQWLHDSVVSTGAKIIHVTPPHYDEWRGGKAGYENTLRRYAAWLLEQRARQKWKVIDIYTPMEKYLAAHRRVDASFNIDGFALSPDGIHPEETGHWIMARQILLYLGFTDAKRYPSIKASLGKIQNGKEIYALVKKRQNLMRDAWLTSTGHLRPGLPTGLPLVEAEEKARDITGKLDTLMKNIALKQRP